MKKPPSSFLSGSVNSVLDNANTDLFPKEAAALFKIRSRNGFERIHESEAITSNPQETGYEKSIGKSDKNQAESLAGSKGI